MLWLVLSLGVSVLWILYVFVDGFVEFLGFDVLFGAGLVCCCG